ncbi:hypothetical protein GCM10022223_32650 [Kineosporia mesophila]|uniref:RHS repeat-associated core domain-containing protein n=1 Tax=Kineosporia mesophila TaxID=566012 RepID=A0ABP6ZME1_9ACTN|nr:RHS repeat-associated core domain-containing protein [Kineosporia mesophila]MCD5353737.1 hypothetical protein [Kineosporia mesophila]
MGGFVLMGVRLYVPRTARFLSIDPVLGGNENAYVYPNDPVNKFDITGMCWSWAKNACRRYNDMKRHPNYVNVKTSAQVGWGVYSVIDPFKKGIVKNLRHPKELLSWGKKTCKGGASFGCASSVFGAGGLKSSWKSYRKSMKYGQEWRRQGTITGRDAVERKYGYR